MQLLPGAAAVFFLAADLVSARKPFIGLPPIIKFLFPRALLRLDLVQDQ